MLHAVVTVAAAAAAAAPLLLVLSNVVVAMQYGTQGQEASDLLRSYSIRDVLRVCAVCSHSRTGTCPL